MGTKERRHNPWRMHPVVEVEADIKGLLAEDGPQDKVIDEPKFKFVVTRHRLVGEALNPYDTEGSNETAPFVNPSDGRTIPAPLSVNLLGGDCVEAIWLVRD